MSNGKRRPTNGAAPPITPDRNQHNGHHLSAALESLGGSMTQWTVMSDVSDPFRMDKPTNHANGAWLADTMTRLGITQQIHDRGLHYAILGEPNPKGEPYVNTGENWEWLQDTVKVARWLGYVPWEQIKDQRNDAPDILMWTPPEPEPYVSVDFEVTVPTAEDLTPQARIDGFVGSQAYHLVLIGEKSSLRDVLGPIATEHGADLYLPAGDPSDTMFYRMAKSGVQDERPMVVLYFSDCDPSGWNMPTVCARKLQAHQASSFPELEFQVHAVALTPDHVREYNLPSTPLKAKEKRAPAWIAATGVEQTEIDALATLQPQLLESLAREAISPFFDSTLARRVRAARNEWLAEAQRIVDEQDGGDRDQLRVNAAAALDAMHDQIQDIMDTVRIDPDQFDLPDPVIPDAITNPDTQPMGLCDSRWPLDEQILRLIARKGYDTQG